MDFKINYLLLLMALPVTAILLILMRQIASQLKLMDVPEQRKIHSHPIPLVGGIVLFIVSAIILLQLDDVDLFSKVLLISTSFVVLVGLLDDVFQLSAFWRFLVQILACLGVIYFSGVKLNTFGELLYPGWDLQLGYLAIPITVFGVVGVINALNMSDGIDGLAALSFFIPTLTLAMISEVSGLSVWLLYVLIALLVFVFFNLSEKYKIFLGDSGSLFLGFVLGWLLVVYSQLNFYQGQSIYPVTALYLVGMPIYDTIYVMLKRISSGKSPFKPDKTHLHHLFISKGYSQSQALLFILLLQIMMIAIGLLFLRFRVAEYIQFYTFILMSVVYYKTMSYQWVKRNIEL